MSDAENFAQLQCMLASERLQFMDAKTALSDTQTELFAEREKNTNLKEVVDHVETLIKSQREHFEDRIDNLQKRHEISLEKHQLKKQLSENLESLKAAYELKIKHLTEEAAHHERMGQSKLVEAKEEIQSLREKCSKLKTDKEECKKDIQTLSEELVEAKEERKEEIQTLREKCSKLKTDKEECKKDIQTLSEELAEAKEERKEEIQTLREKCSKLKTDREECKKDIQTLSEALAEAKEECKEEIQSLREKCSKLKTDKEECKKNIQILSEECSKLKNDKEECKKETQALREECSKLKTGKEKCEKEIETMSEENSKLKTDKEECKKEIHSLSQDCFKLEADKEECKNEIQILQEQCSKLKTDKEEYEKEIQSLREERSKLRTDKEEEAVQHREEKTDKQQQEHLQALEEFRHEMQMMKISFCDQIKVLQEHHQKETNLSRERYKECREQLDMYKQQHTTPRKPAINEILQMVETLRETNQSLLMELRGNHLPHRDVFGDMYMSKRNEKDIWSAATSYHGENTNMLDELVTLTREIPMQFQDAKVALHHKDEETRRLHNEVHSLQATLNLICARYAHLKQRLAFKMETIQRIRQLT